MLVVYDNLLRLAPEPMGEKTEFAACAAARIMLCLSTDDFRVEYKDGKASVHLTRHITNDEARALAAALTKRAQLLDDQAKQWQTVTSTSHQQ
jgi:hypothetical protein